MLVFEKDKNLLEPLSFSFYWNVLYVALAKKCHE